ncbi:UvrD-helicase domain-containing protein [Amycolatopsis lexingtonensis]|uniref:UvrD-helicase domain-containing protein n=1 Tax=Amycolatopsis lexingtonensis TaxID=218822 RepID=UPI003F722367
MNPPTGPWVPEEAAAAWCPTGIDDLEPAAWDALRAAYLLQTGLCAPPHRILAISFKRDAAANLARRVEQRVPEHAGRFVSLTFDAFTKGLLDRFKSSLPPGWAIPGRYELTFPKDREQRDFINYLAAGTTGTLRAALDGLPRPTFLAKVVGAWPLPPEPPADDPADAVGLAAWRWWQERYLHPETPFLDFVMINRLAELLVRALPQLRRALRATYPFVFVDEFQDTTIAQFSFLETTFSANAVVTAVGDRKQRIMGFAGALTDAVPRFIATFSAHEYPLTWNFRSTDPLVALQHVIAGKLDPAAVRAESRVEAEPAGEPVSLWRFPNLAREAAVVADWIARDIEQSARTAADFAFVARQKVADLEPRLREALTQHGIRLRNDDAAVGKMRLQDLLKNDVTRLLLGVLRLAAQPDGLGQVWLETSALLRQVRGAADDDTAIRHVHDELSQLAKHTRAWLADNPAGAADPGEAVDQIVGGIGADALASYVRSAARGEELAVILDAFQARLAAVAGQAENWTAAFVEFESVDAVALMTVHKSKGLEHHTVFFLGLDDDQWWAHARDREESTSAFFVGLSRAAHRLIFTTASTYTQRITELFEMLRAAGVPEHHW